MSRWVWFGVVFWVMNVDPAYADLEGSLSSLLDQIKALSTPVAIILLIFAGWQRMMGNTHIFIAALIGTLIMFGAPQIVELVSAVFL
jgi:type IV secretory pathway VirB2 component (pilin)